MRHKTDLIPPSQAIRPVFAWLVLIVFSYAIYQFFWYLSSWVEYLPPAGIFAIAGYTCAISLFESLLLLGGLLLLAALFPERWLRGHFASQGSLIVLVLAAWAGLLQLAINRYLDQIAQLKRLIPGGEITLSLALLVLLVTTLILAPYFVANRWRSLEKRLLSLSERITIFLYIYIPLGLLGLVIVIARNLT